MQDTETGHSPQDLAYQDHALQGVSRTFALTIPQLPGGVAKVVGNAYLLCRIADTIEDENALTAEQKALFSGQFIDVVAGKGDPSDFANGLSPLLTETMLEAERELVRKTDSVIRITHSFNAVQRKAIERCIRIMSSGMSEFQRTKKPDCLRDMPHMDSYCYHVAGVVGEMLTEIFCDYSPAIAEHRELLMKLSVSFGQGLQMTNILKDVWEDKQRDACWLPRDVFTRAGYDLRDLQPGRNSDAFGAALSELVGIAAAHLRNALEYTLLLPRHEKGLRRFCLWALGMAVLTLRKIDRHPGFTRGNEVKITRRSVRATIAATNLLVSSDRALRLLFKLMTRPLAAPELEQYKSLAATRRKPSPT